MRVEVLFPEIANLYGELGNIRYLEKSVTDIYVKETSVNEKPAFLDSNEERFDLVYMGTMSESSQLLVMEKLAPKGVMVFVEAEHMCMTMRGIKKPGSKTVTTAARGVFETDGALREAFWHMLGR